MSNYDSNNPAGTDPYGQGNQGQPEYGQQQPGQYGDQSQGYGAAPGYSPMPGGGGPVGTPPNNNLALAIITTVLCCLPLGVVAIIQASKVNGLWQAGDVAGAQEAADKAKKFSIYSAIAGVIFYVIYGILMLTVLKDSNA